MMVHHYSMALTTKFYNFISETSGKVYDKK